MSHLSSVICHWQDVTPYLKEFYTKLLCMLDLQLIAVSNDQQRKDHHGKRYRPQGSWETDPEF